MLEHVRTIYHWTRARKWKIQIQVQHRVWLNQQRRRGVEIHSSTEFTGKLSLEDIQISPECRIERDLTIWRSCDTGANPCITIKHKAYLGRNCFLNAFQPITIGIQAMIGAYCYITSANHCYERRDLPIMNQGFVGAPVVIEDNAWLGTHVVVLPGVTIGKGAIVAAGSVVSKDVPPYEVWGGVPAKRLKIRPGALSSA
jgi:acetyltransferase-like isoleucine patch superfamily enzyme